MSTLNSQPKLSVNLNKVALLRNARDIGIPSVVVAGQRCIEAGAHGLTVHPRPDQRHIRTHDVHDLVAFLRDYPAIEFNIEGNPFTGEWLDLVRQIKPTQATLVPDSPEQATSDHGWNISRDGGRIEPVIRELQALGIRVSLFMDPDEAQIEQVAALAPERIELYTEPFAAAFAQTDSAAADAMLARYRQASACAVALGLSLNAGHDLNLANLPHLLTIPALLECSIGHALIADALEFGLHQTVKKYLAVMAG